jgi:hypothetical protein
MRANPARWATQSLGHAMAASSTAPDTFGDRVEAFSCVTGGSVLLLFDLLFPFLNGPLCLFLLVTAARRQQ